MRAQPQHKRPARGCARMSGRPQCTVGGRHAGLYGLFSTTDAPEEISLHPTGAMSRTFSLRHLDARRDRLTQFAYVARPMALPSSRVSFPPAEWPRLAGLYGFIGML